jgi:hypothetical protein
MAFPSKNVLTARHHWRADDRCERHRRSSRRQFSKFMRLPTAPALANARGEDLGTSAPVMRRVRPGYPNQRKQ